MKKILFILTAFILTCSYTQGQSYVIANTFSTISTSPSDNLIGNGAAFHKLTWNVLGTVSSCTVALDSSVDGNSWTAGGVIAGQTCTTNGTILSSSAVVNFVRINMTAFVGTGTVTVVDQGFLTNPGGGGGTGTVTSCGPGNAVYTASGTTVTCDPLITDSSLNGTLNFTQGSIASSAPFINHTVTWTSVGNLYNDFLTNITCTNAGINSSPFNIQVASVSIFSLKFASLNCGNPQLQIPDGSSSNPGLFFTTDGNTTGLFRNGANDWGIRSAGNVFFRASVNAGVEVQAAANYTWSSTAQANGTIDTCITRNAAGVVRIDTNTACNDALGKMQAQAYLTSTNCSATGTAANPSVASCTAASSGSISCATNASTGTCTVNTTAVTANSEILLTQRTDTTTGTRLSVTCNTTVDTVQRVITAVTAATSFTFNLGTITTNPECFSYVIIN